jgi:1,4-dihydroxy-2-naphthoate octaprenyltransferase
MKEKIGAWLALSRLPFHLVGVLPFILGSALAWRFLGLFRWDILLWGILGVVLIMLATYYAGEYWDYEGDELAAQQGPSRFAGGSQVLQRGLIARRTALYASVVCVILAAIIGLVLQFIYLTGPLTILLGAIGIIGGFFYSAKPIRWVNRGLGEIWIAFNYGWLTIAASFYLQAGFFIPLIHFMALPVAFTIFNVILLNEFPDYEADRDTGKRNLVVRLGLKRSAILYSLVAIASWFTMAPILALGFHWPLSFLAYLPVMAISVGLVILMLRGAWKNRSTLEKLCGLNILVNLGTTLVFIVSVIVL